jgi:hemerythrin-like domain-containing protein
MSLCDVLLSKGQLLMTTREMSPLPRGIQDRSLPTGGFEVPLEMLSACHARIEGQCATLRRLVPHLASHGADEDARSAAAAVMRYFDTAAKHHHEDEEKDLFPALVESMAGSDPVCLREMTQGLAAEHRELEARWHRLRTVLEQIAAGHTVPLSSDDVEALVGLYERHMEREEQELLPMAARLLSDEELERIGRAMRERRGIQLPG